MKKLHINPNLKSLSKPDFTKWFNSHWKDRNDLDEQYSKLHPAKGSTDKKKEGEG